MSVDPTTGQYQDVDTRVVKAAAIESASTVGAAVFVGDKGTLRLTLATTAAVAPTSLDVILETSADGTTFRAMNPAAAFTQVTSGTSSERKCFPGCDRYVRYSSTIVGTSFTYGITGEAV